MEFSTIEFTADGEVFNRATANVCEKSFGTDGCHSIGIVVQSADGVVVAIVVGFVAVGGGAADAGISTGIPVVGVGGHAVVDEPF